MANLLYRIRLGPVYTYPHILIPKTDIFTLVLRRCPHVKGFSGNKIAGFRADRLRVDRRNGSSRIRLILKKKENSNTESSEKFSELHVRIKLTTLRVLVRTL